MYEIPRVQRAVPSRPLVTISVLVLATLGSLLFWSRSSAMTWATADPWPIWDGQLWRFVTTVFLHGNLLHLAFNLYWLWLFGTAVEKWMGSALFAGFFVLVGSGASAAEFLAFASGGIGLSGVVYGLFGLLYALRRHKDFAVVLLTDGTIRLFVIWFFVCIVLTVAKIMPVANVAHGAGCVLGWLIGSAILERRRIWLLAGLTVVALGLVVAPLYMPWNGTYAWYRGNRAFEQRDYGEALYWYRKAERAHPDSDFLRDQVRYLEQTAKEKDSG
jgi:GlpG protein